MRSVLLAAVAVVAGVVVPASPAYAADCFAAADSPQAVGGQVYGDGHLRCLDRSTLTVTVCIEALYDLEWGTVTCETATASGDYAEARVWACVQDAPLVRTYVFGSSADGGYATATSAPGLPGVGSCGP